MISGDVLLLSNSAVASTSRGLKEGDQGCCMVKGLAQICEGLASCQAFSLPGNGSLQTLVLS